MVQREVRYVAAAWRTVVWESDRQQALANFAPLAPGFGDPTNFRVDDCSTQRNLDDRGRQQSRAIGQEFRQLNYSAPTVYSSPWCRCLDTARLMQIGPVTAFQGLGSFFEGHVDRSQSLNALSEKLSSIAYTPLLQPSNASNKLS